MVFSIERFALRRLFNRKFGTLLLLFLLLTATALKSQRKFLFLYRDTSIVYNGYRIDVTKTYLRKLLFIKSTITIHNNSDQYLILNRQSVFVSADDGKLERFLNNEDPVFKPGAFYKQRLKFKATPRTNTLTFHFKNAMVTDAVIRNYLPLDIPMEPGTIRKLGNLTISVLKVTPFDRLYEVRIRVEHDADEFLAINFENISATGTLSGKITNKTKVNHRMHHRKSKYLEMATLKFPIQAGEKLQKTIHFENVFTEYQLRSLYEFDLKYTVNIDAPKRATEGRKKKQLVKE